MREYAQVAENLRSVPPLHGDALAFGLQFVHPLGESSLAYFIRAGGTLNHIKIENDEGDIVADSKQGLGFIVQTPMARFTVMADGYRDTVPASDTTRTMGLPLLSRSTPISA